MDQPTPRSAFCDALTNEDWDNIEELWLEALDERPVPTAELLEVRRRLWKAGNQSLALTLLELLADGLEAQPDYEGAVAALAELTRLSPRAEDDLLERLERAFSALHADSPSLQAVLSRYRLRQARKPIETLQAMTCWLEHDRGTVVEVVGHGVGQVSDVNLELDTIKVDVGERRPVSVPFGAIARYLRRLPVGNFRRRAVEDPEAVRIFANSEPGNALVELLESFEEPTDVASIKRALNGIVAADSWTGWWNKARSDRRVLASGTGSRLRYSATGSAESATDVQLSELKAASPRDRLALARRIANRDSGATPAVAAILEESLATLEQSDPGVAWETTTILVELASGSAEAADSRARLVARTQPLRLLSGVQDRVARIDALAAIRSARPDDWIEVWAEWLLHEQHPMVLRQIATTVAEAGQLEMLDASLEAVFRNHTDHADQFVWACEEMATDDCPEPLRRRMTPSVLEKIPDTLSRSEFAGVRGRAKALLEGGRVAVRLILETASPQQTERFISRITRISSIEPQRLRVLEQAARHATGTVRNEQPPALVATRAAIESKRAELKQLLEVDIPQTLKGIQSAAAEGDLRENFEYHMLRDRQELQSARAAALQRDLGQVLVLEPGAADASRVNIGTVVELTHPDGHPLEPITILGSWDADVERRIYASGSGVAQRLLGREVGDEVELDGVRATIQRITPWTDQR